MVKIKNAESLSLVKSEQKKVSKKTKALKKKIKEGKITVKERKKSSLDQIKRKKSVKKETNATKTIDTKEKKIRKVSIKELKKAKANKTAEKRGVIYIGHIPHGFYENEMKKYFKQFGAVTNVKVCRSGRTGNSKGYGYVEFADPDVAKIAAETMNNYIMFKKRVVAKFVPFEKRPKGLFSAKRSTIERYSAKVRREKQMAANAKVDSKTFLKRSKSRLSHLNKKLEKLQKLGIDYDFKPVDVPEALNLEKSDVNVSKNSDVQNDTHFYQTDPYDSEIEVKIPLKKSVKSLESSKIKKKKTETKSKGITKKKTVTKSKGITKKKVKKELPLNADTVKKIARELIRKRGDSLLNIVTTPKKNKPSKKKSK